MMSAVTCGYSLLMPKVTEPIILDYCNDSLVVTVKTIDQAVRNRLHDSDDQPVDADTCSFEDVLC